MAFTNALVYCLAYGLACAIAYIIAFAHAHAYALAGGIAFGSPPPFLPHPVRPLPPPPSLGGSLAGLLRTGRP